MLLEPPLVMLAQDRIEALRAQAKTHWLISLARSKSAAKKPKLLAQTRKTPT